MSGDGPAGPGSLSPTRAEELDRACDRFEAAWRAGGRPDLAAYLAGAEGSERVALACELIAVDVHWRGRSGERPTAEEYLMRFPGEADAVWLYFGPGSPTDATIKATRSDAAVAPFVRDTVDASARTAKVGRDAVGVTPVPTADGTLTVPGYEILSELGRGGMGVVYKARHLRLDRPVALKMILPGQLGGPTVLQRFRAEAEAVVRLDHPNIVPVYEVGESGGRPFYSMKLMKGGSLADRADRFTNDLAAAARLVAAVAKAVHHAHQRGLIHRDLKPANILMDAEDRPYVTDFGLVKWVEGESSLTETGAILGTPAYMAPEQATGQQATVTTLADLYSLGVILYRLIAGRPPFRGDTPMETLAQVVEQPPVPPHVHNTKIDLDLSTVCLKCLSKDPAQRYPSALALAEELERWIAGDPIRARSPSLMGVARSLARRHAKVAVGIVAVGLVGGVLCGLSLYGTDIQTPLAWATGSYPSLEVAGPWLATAIRLPSWLVTLLGMASGLWLTSLGLMAVLLARPRNAAGDVAAGLTAGVVTGVAALCSGVGWALIYGTSISNTLEGYESRVVSEVGLTGPRAESEIVVHEYLDEMGRPSRLEVSPGWQHESYPGLKERSLPAQAALLRRKVRTELMVGVQVGIWYCLLAVGAIVAIGGAEGAVAGLMLRRYGCVRRVVVAYIEAATPGVSAVYAAVALAVNLLTWRPSFRPETWLTALILASAATAAAAGRWSWPTRRAVQAAWIGVLVAILIGAWPPHRS